LEERHKPTFSCNFAAASEIAQAILTDQPAHKKCPPISTAVSARYVKAAMQTRPPRLAELMDWVAPDLWPRPSGRQGPLEAVRFGDMAGALRS